MGLNNYLLIVQDLRVWESFAVSVVFAAISLSFQFVIGFGVTLLAPGDPVPRLIRTIIIIPLMLTTVIWGWTAVDAKRELGDSELLTGCCSPDQLHGVRRRCYRLVLVNIWHPTSFIVLVIWPGSRACRRAVQSAQYRRRERLAEALVPDDPAAPTVDPGHHAVPLVRAGPGLRSRLRPDERRAWAADRDDLVPHLQPDVPGVPDRLRLGDLVRAVRDLPGLVHLDYQGCRHARISGMKCQSCPVVPEKIGER